MPDTQIREDAVTPARLPTCGNHINQSMVAHESAASIFYLTDGGSRLLKTFIYFYQSTRRHLHGCCSKKLLFAYKQYTGTRSNCYLRQDKSRSVRFQCLTTCSTPKFSLPEYEDRRCLRNAGTHRQD